MHKRLIKWGLVGILILIFGYIYRSYNPLESDLFPKCPFLSATGLKCAGCGSQRAIHHLLNFHVWEAMKENLLLVFAVPYIVTGFVFDVWKDKQNPTYLKWRKRLFGLHATYVVLFIVISFWILRNLF